MSAAAARAAGGLAGQGEVQRPQLGAAEVQHHLEALQQCGFATRKVGGVSTAKGAASTQPSSGRGRGRPAAAQPSAPPRVAVSEASCPVRAQRKRRMVPRIIRCRSSRARPSSNMSIVSGLSGLGRPMGASITITRTATSVSGNHPQDGMAFERRQALEESERILCCSAGRELP